MISSTKQICYDISVLYVALLVFCLFFSLLAFQIRYLVESLCSLTDTDFHSYGFHLFLDYQSTRSLCYQVLCILIQPIRHYHMYLTKMLLLSHHAVFFFLMIYCFLEKKEHNSMENGATEEHSGRCRKVWVFFSPSLLLQYFKHKHMPSKSVSSFYKIIFCEVWLR